MTKMTGEEAKMLAGELYLASAPELVAKRARARELTRRYNATSPRERDARRRLLTQLLTTVGEDVEIEPPFHCDYGTQIVIGAGVYINVGCVVLDCAQVVIGDQALLGPGVHIYAATHPVDPGVRRSGRELAAPVSIGADVWLGGGAIVCPGVTIGAGTTIGAGSVVTRAIPPGVVAAGNPCRILRALNPATARPGP
jgi:maltose O-acetyltransferase